MSRARETQGLLMVFRLPSSQQLGPLIDEQYCSGRERKTLPVAIVFVFSSWLGVGSHSHFSSTCCHEPRRECSPVNVIITRLLSLLTYEWGLQCEVERRISQA